MSLNPRDDLVSMTAIVAGAVVSVAVTIGSMILSGGDESRDFIYEVDRGGWVPYAEVEMVGGERLGDVLAARLGPAEWEAVNTYRTIEAMTPTYPSNEVVDRTLDELGAIAMDNPDNGFVQGLYLKALRVSEHNAVDVGDRARAEGLQRRFELFAPLVMRYEVAGIESILFTTQRLERSCENSQEEMDRLVAVMNRFPNSAAVAALFVQGLEHGWSCDRR